MSKIEINNIDFGMLKKQKKTLIYALAELEKRCTFTHNTIKDEEGNKMHLSDIGGIIFLIDHIQDEAVKQLGLDENEVFDLTED